MKTDKTITTTVTVGEGGFVDIRAFKDLIDIKKVVYYSIRKKRNQNAAILKFYDKKMKLIKPKTSKKKVK